MTNWKKPGTAIAATAWVAVCAYLYFAWPSLAALLEILALPGVEPFTLLPRAAFIVVGLLAMLGLILKDRCLRAPLALVVDAVIGAPALLVIAFLLHPFMVPIE